jgi:CMP-N,N'-diacetyllegionaminic acid synthase
MDDKKNLAIIPARSGSKGLKDKNIKPLNGKPLLAYTIEAATNSNLFDEIYVSTDSMVYADIAIEYGAHVPFLRSSELATDRASSWDVVKEAIHCYKLKGKTFDMVTLLQPTAPLRTGQDIIEAYNVFTNNEANAVVAVCEVEYSPLWCNTLPENNSLSNFIDKNISKLPRQQLEVYYRINGAIYMLDTKYFNRCESIYDSKCFAYTMKKEHSIDIDDEFDFNLATAIMNMKIKDS